MESQIIRFETNVPVECALKYSDGLPKESQFGGMEFMFSTTDGRRIYLKPEAAKQLEELGIQPGQPISICKREVKNGRSKSFRTEVKRIEGAPAPAFVPRPEIATPAATTTTQLPTLPTDGNQQRNGSSYPTRPTVALDDALDYCGMKALDFVKRFQAGCRKGFNDPDFRFIEEDVRVTTNSIFILFSQKFNISFPDVEQALRDGGIS